MRATSNRRTKKLNYIIHLGREIGLPKDDEVLENHINWPEPTPPADDDVDGKWSSRSFCVVQLSAQSNYIYI